MTAPAQPKIECSGCGKPMTRWWYDALGRAYCVVCAKARQIIR